MEGADITKEVDFNDLIRSGVICGIWVTSETKLSAKRLCSLLKKYPAIRCFLCCVWDWKTARVLERLLQYRDEKPFLRIALIGDERWYKESSCAEQAYICGLLDLADYYLTCVYPLRDAFFHLLFCSDILVLENSLKQGFAISGFLQEEHREIIYI